MTPAIHLTKQKKIDHTLHEYKYDSSADSYGLEAAENVHIPGKLGLFP